MPSKPILCAWRAFTPVILAFAGCSSVDKAPLSAAITQKGEASIEQSHGGPGFGFGVIKTQFLIVGIDGKFPTTGNHGVFALPPGPHDIRIVAQFSYTAIDELDLVIDAGETSLRFDSAGGLRYRVTGRELTRKMSEVWIEEVSSGREVTAHTPVPLQANAQNIPILVPIPIR